MGKEVIIIRLEARMEDGMRKRSNYRSEHKKEKIIMLASSLFVLSALTVTGFYVREKNQSSNDNGYVVDFSKLGSQADGQAENLADTAIENQNPQSDISKELQAIDDMDYDPAYREANSLKVKNENTQEAVPEDVQEETPEDAPGGQEEGSARETADEKAVETAAGAKRAFSFKEDDTLQWPAAGNVLLNYSMDKTIYFATLQEYKYNPAIVIEAKEGTVITAAAAGEVAAVYRDAEIGQAVDINIGDGYQVTYGQLKDIPLLEGDIIKAGDIVGYVTQPSKYYSVEGSNVYFKLTKNGTPLNPMEKLE